MKIEQSINTFLNKFPLIKKIIKRIYQLIMYLISPKIKFEGNIKRITPNDEYEYFFGYYDKSPWDKTERYMLCLRVKNAWKSVAPDSLAEIVLIDTTYNNSIEIIGKTKAWNVQQGCMLQWLGPDYKSKIIYNDFRNDEFCSIIYDINTKKEKKLKLPVYSVSSDGKFALSLDFSRLHILRPGYGYSNKKMKKIEKKPIGTCIWKIDLTNNEIVNILKYDDFYNFESNSKMNNAVHKINHLMLNPSNKRFMVMHRYFVGKEKYTRLITCDVNGKNMYILSDDGMVSHCCWKNNKEIFGFLHKNKSGNGYYLMEDKSNYYTKCFEELCNDGHPSYSPDKSKIVIDTYPNRKRIQEIKILNLKEKSNNVNVVAKVFAPFRYDNDTRCDLHPRWNYSGNKISFDGSFEGRRKLYVVELRK